MSEFELGQEFGLLQSPYEKISKERKDGQEVGDIPSWYTTPGYVSFISKFLSRPDQGVRERYQEMSDRAGEIAQKLYGDTFPWAEKFFDIIWNGFLSPSTPVLANLGAGRGMPISCSGNVISDSIHGFYSSRLEVAMLTKNGFGTSSYLGAVRPRGSKISSGGFASGVVPVLKGFVQDMQDVSQGSSRRGAWAGYLEVEHGDFDEVCDLLARHPDNLNVGWIIGDDFLSSLSKGHKDSIRRYQRIMKTRVTTGKGYLFFRDKANRLAPENDPGMKILASNLCIEIMLPSDEMHTYACVLSSLNVSKFDQWPSDLIFYALVFLDCINEELINIGSQISGLENTVRFAIKARSLGLGVLGFHSYVQAQGWAMEDLQTQYFNKMLFERIDEETKIASLWMGNKAGSPDWVVGDHRNLHRIAIAPTMSTALICGGVSQGIEPLVANAFTQNSNSGDFNRVNPNLIPLMKERSVYSNSTILELAAKNGSVQAVSWLSDEEKRVFRTAFEIDQEVLLRLASQRQQNIDQGQSLNLFFAADEDPAYISKIHRMAAEDPYIKSLYYLRSQSGVKPNRGECESCEG